MSFICRYCNQVRDWASQMVIMACSPDDENCAGIIAGMPYINTGICTVCMEGEE